MITPAILVFSLIVTGAGAFAGWRLVPEAIRRSRPRSIVCFCVVWAAVAYGGTKPPGPGPEPDKPVLTSYARIYARINETNAISPRCKVEVIE